jgi:ADP-ribosylglycohydrolase
MKDHLQGSLLGVRIGDALGMPVETMSPAEILAATDGKGVTGFLDAIQTKYPDQAMLKKGDPTDDWQFNRIVAKSLIACRGYNQADMARRHVAEKDVNMIGWGKTTRSATMELATYFASGGQYGRDPNNLPEAKPDFGGGNGVGMKVFSLPSAILAAEYGAQYRYPEYTLFRWVEQLTMLTHSHSDAFFTAYALAVAFDACVRDAVYTSSDAQRLLQKIDFELAKVENASRYRDVSATRKQIGRLMYCIGNPGKVTENFPPYGLAIQSVPFALGIFLTYPGDARKALLTCVNAGYDCDTTAAMCGSLLGANGGVEAFPAEWRNFRPDFQEPLELGERLYQAFARTSQQTS